MTDIRYYLRALLTAIVALLFADQVAAQTTAVVSGGSGKELVATLINTAGVVLVVEVIKWFLPTLRAHYGWALPLVATGVGPVVAYLQSTIAAWAGVQVDFTPIVAALTGAAATAAHQVSVQAKAARARAADEK